MTKIIAFAGKKQSGKGVCANFIIASEMKELGMVQQQASLTDAGEIFISDLYGDPVNAIFNPRLNAELIKDRLDIGLYSFADMLKNVVCIQLLGLQHQQCYGTDEEKNTQTHLKWENMPDNWEPGFPNPSSTVGMYTKPKSKGHMTAREVMQYVGTNIFRKMYHEVWVKATLNTIKRENVGLAILDDCRFRNEAEYVSQAGGKVIHLTRNQQSKDSHASETSLQHYQSFDATLDNQTMDIPTQNKELYKILHKWDYLDIPFFNDILKQEQ